ncbi:MAG: hypothetical protein IRZ16_05245 [Myxococcaceae bacterium]|nr:hypothetical protein [Myxococcaceae bacterium]
MKVLALLALLVSTLSFAAADDRVDRGIELYDRGEHALARDALVTVVEAPTLSTADRIRARSYLAAAYYALGDVASAKAQLLVLAREQPSYQLDSGVFSRELVALADEARAEVAREPRPPEPATPKPIPRTAPPAVAAHAPPTPPKPPLGLMLIPFGVGQYALDQNVKGTLFLGTEVVSFGVSGVALAMFESNKVTGRFLQGGAFRDPQQAQTLQTIYLVAGWTGVALMAAGVIDALVSRAELPESGGLASGASFPARSMSFTGQGVLIRF